MRDGEDFKKIIIVRLVFPPTFYYRKNISFLLEMLHFVSIVWYFLVLEKGATLYKTLILLCYAVQDALILLEDERNHAIWILFLVFGVC